MTMLANAPSRATAAARSDLDLSAVARRFRRVASVLPRSALLYDVATRSDEALLVSLAREGAGFAVGDPSAAPAAGRCALRPEHRAAHQPVRT